VEGVKVQTTDEPVCWIHLDTYVWDPTIKDYYKSENFYEKRIKDSIND